MPEPDWATWLLDPSFIATLPPPRPEHRAEHKRAMDFERFSEDPETKDVSKLFLFGTQDSTVAESNLRLSNNVKFLQDYDAHDHAEELPLWWNSGVKRMKGIAPEEPLDDRPDIYFQDSLRCGHEESLIRSSDAETVQAEPVRAETIKAETIKAETNKAEGTDGHGSAGTAKFQ
ncbi:MAG: hypothetical protein Q9160_003052 [Pyrenula sp. 1 TL-2023]